MSGLRYKPCLAKPDLWLKPQSREDGTGYYAYILCYVDDVLVVHDDAQPVLDRIDKFMKLKPGSSEPDMYLGAKLKKVTLANDVVAWSISPSKYGQEAVRNCGNHVKENFSVDFQLLKYAPNHVPINYEPEIDVSRELTPDKASYYQTIIGIMRWMIESGRVDIGVEVSKLSSFLAYPRKGHMEAALHIMAYLRAKHNLRLVLDPTYAGIDYAQFNIDADWHAFYGDVRPWTNAVEANPALLAERETFVTQAKEALGPSVTVSDFEDIDLTPDFDHYADDEDGFEGTPDELPTQLLHPTPEVNDNYVGAELMLP